MQEYSIKSDSIDWKVLRGKTLKSINTAMTTEETHDVLRSALNQLKDHHSFLITPLSNDRIQSSQDLPNFQYGLLEGDIGYLRVPSFIGNDKLAISYVKRMGEIIGELESRNPKGWIIDLTQNSGGNMYPMILGLAPFLGEGILGYFVDPKQNKLPWRLSNGSILMGDNVVMKNPNRVSVASGKRIAVLISGMTASSGEAVAISFIGNTNTRIFGKPTRGLTTGNATFNLSDGSVLALTNTIFMDRKHKIYGNPIEPDKLSKWPKYQALIWFSQN